MAERSKPVILLIDDQASVVRVLERMLQNDYQLLSATSGEAGISMAIAMLPDLILLDMVMPEMSGIEVCQSLGHNPLTKKIPVIFVTSMDDRHNEEAGFRAGAVDYITKPPSAGIVQARVRVHLQKARLARFIEMIASGYLSDPDQIRSQAKTLLE